MKYNDHEFDPVTDEERAAREREEELARRIRREVLRVQSGEADEEIRADREREQAEEEARQYSGSERSLGILSLHDLHRRDVFRQHLRNVHGAAPRHEILAALPRGPDAARALAAVCSFTW